MSTLVSQRPAAAQPRAWDYPVLERRTLPSGLELAFCHCPGRPFINARLTLHKGAIHEPEEMLGVTQMMAGHMSRATEKRDYVELGLTMERLAAGLGCGAGWHTMNAGVGGPIWTFAEATEVLCEVIHQPAFPNEEIVKDIAARRVGMARRVKNPGALASKAFNSAVYTDDTVYLREFTYESLDRLNDRDAIVDVYQSVLGSASAALVIAGDLDQFDVEPFAAALGASWPVRPVEEVPHIEARNLERHIVLVNRVGSVQSVIRAGHIGPARKIPDRVPLGTFTHAFGGSSHSRLSRVLREEKGYTYGIGAGFSRRRHTGTFSVSTEVQNDATAPTVVEIVRQLEQARDSGITAEEFDRSKRSRLGSFPLQFQEVGNIAGVLGSILEDDLPLTYLPDTYEALISHTLDDVNAVAAKYLDPEHLVIVVVGDAAVVKDDLEAAGVGPVEVVQPEDLFPPEPEKADTGAAA